jgi:nucleotide-binding universal stress UspA family protein
MGGKRKIQAPEGHFKIARRVQRRVAVNNLKSVPEGRLNTRSFSGTNLDQTLERTLDQTMYDTILVTLDGTSTDRAIIEHVKQLAKLAHSRLVLLHVADGWAARTYGPDAVSPEIAEDTAYLQKVQAEFQSAGISTDAQLAYGEPANQIIKWVEQKHCDLVAMSTHGHRFLADLFLGSTATKVRHSIAVPILLLRAK